MSGPVAEVFVSRAFDVTFGALSHSCLPIPPAPKFSPSVEMIATQMWTFGFFTGQNKLTKSGLQNGVPYCLAGHDIGPMVPDVTLAFPPNANYAIMWPFSSRKIMFASTIAMAEGKPTGCTQPFIVPLPMMTCGDPISLPVIFGMSNPICNTKVGISLGDIFRGVAAIVVAVVIDLIFMAIKNKKAAEKKMKIIAGDLPAEKAKTLGRQIAEGIVGKVVPTSKVDWAKKGVSAACNFGLGALDGDPTFKMAPVTSPLGDLGFKWNPGEGAGAEWPGKDVPSQWRQLQGNGSGGG